MTTLKSNCIRQTMENIPLVTSFYGVLCVCWKILHLLFETKVKLYFFRLTVQTCGTQKLQTRHLYLFIFDVMQILFCLISLHTDVIAPYVKKMSNFVYSQNFVFNKNVEPNLKLHFFGCDIKLSFCM